MNAIKSTYRFFDDGYTAPTSAEVRRAFADRNRQDIADMLGVEVRTIYRWMGRRGDNSTRRIPYSAWRLFLILTGQLNPWSGKVNHDRL
jgi:hypothetical protein